MLNVYNNDKTLCIWACQERSSDKIMIICGSENTKDINNMFSEDAYNNAKYFSYDDYDSAVNYVYKQLKYIFKENINVEHHYKFDTYKGIEDLRRICEDAESLDYEDYYDMASFFDEDEKYSCDLIIMDGKMGYRYNIHTEDGMDNLTFEPVEPNLENEITLMIDMQNHLNKFIEDELDYSISMDTNIKI